MKKRFFLVLIASLLLMYLNAQNNKGINFQGIARNSNGLVITNKIISLRLSIKTDSLNGNIEYQEIKSVTTNVIGLFSVVVGSSEERKMATIGNFENISWAKSEKYLQVEVDITGDFYFINLGTQKINYVPFAFYADKVDAKNINGLVSINQGGTGFDNIKDFKNIAAIDKVNNTPDSVKPTSQATLILLNEKLKKTDTLYLSNRINQKLNATDTIKLYNKISQIPVIDTTSLSNRINLKLSKIDTISLSNRIDLKLNKLDTAYLSNRINQKLNASDTIKLYNKISQIPVIDTTSLSNRIDNKINIGSLSSKDIITALNYTPLRNDYGSFYDTSKQITTVLSAISVKFGFTGFANNISITNNTSGLPARITVANAGVYLVKYALQFIKTDANSDEVSVWIRRNSAAYVNTNNTYTIQGSGIKNTIINSFFVDLGVDDYVEIYFTVKNINTSITGTGTQLSPSRPATPSAMVTIQRVN